MFPQHHHRISPQILTKFINIRKSSAVTKFKKKVIFFFYSIMYRGGADKLKFSVSCPLSNSIQPVMVIESTFNTFIIPQLRLACLERNWYSTTLYFVARCGLPRHCRAVLLLVSLMMEKNKRTSARTSLLTPRPTPSVGLALMAYAVEAP